MEATLAGGQKVLQAHHSLSGDSLHPKLSWSSFLSLLLTPHKNTDPRLSLPYGISPRSLTSEEGTTKDASPLVLIPHRFISTSLPWDTWNTCAGVAGWLRGTLHTERGRHERTGGDPILHCDWQKLFTHYDSEPHENVLDWKQETMQENNNRIQRKENINKRKTRTTASQLQSLLRSPRRQNAAISWSINPSTIIGFDFAVRKK